MKGNRNICRWTAWLCAAVIMVAPTPAYASVGGVKDNLTPSRFADGELVKVGAVVLRTEYESYSPDIPRISYTISNSTGSPVEHGSRFDIEVQQNGAWQTIGFGPGNWSWTSELRMVQPGATVTEIVTLGNYRFNWREGRYRIVKELGGKLYAGEFTMSKSSPITADTPYGYPALEKLPASYGAEAAAKEGVMVIGAPGITANGDRLTAFIDKAEAGTASMVRMLYHNAQGKQVLADAIFETGYWGQSHVVWRQRVDGTISESRYSYLATYPAAQGTGIALSDYAAADYYPRGYTPSAVLYDPAWGGAAAVVNKVAAMEKERMRMGDTKMKVFSAGGVVEASLFTGDSAGQYSFGSERMGSSQEVAGRDVTDLYDIRWMNSSTFAVFGTAGNRAYLETCKIDFDKLSGLKTASYYADCFAVVPGTGQAVYWSGGEMKTLEGTKLCSSSNGQKAVSIQVSGSGREAGAVVTFADKSTITGRFSYDSGGKPTGFLAS